MGSPVIASSVNHRRIARARLWLEARKPTEEVLIVGATLDAANELVRPVVKDKGVALGWHRLTLAQLAAVTACSQIPYATHQGIFLPYQGNQCERTGNFGI